MKTEQLYQIFLQHPVVSTDSRKIAPGSIFFALKGENFDGNRFAASALEAGAAFVVVDDPQMATHEKFLLVDDVLTALQQLAAFHRKQLALPILAITGTNGKTTTKELVAAVLAEKFNVEFTRGNLNNHIGVPLTLLSFTKETQFGVVEMGANHPGEIDFLCRLATPNFGIITNVGKAHLEGFGSFEGVIQTKSELYRHLEKNGGKIFLNSDNSYLRAVVGEKLEKIEYGQTEGAWLRGETVQSPPFL
ncbi:MAG TPA: Mur ligase family protein, partial [Prolixibacteraceae bacterium]|nr:Mur ligase family protein [Prolixibacteraceae bacterium]